jgi:hypothetical protein
MDKGAIPHDVGGVAAMMYGAVFRQSAHTYHRRY